MGGLLSLMVIWGEVAQKFNGESQLPLWKTKKKMSKLHGMRFYNFKIVCIESTRTKYVRNYIHCHLKQEVKLKEKEEWKVFIMNIQKNRSTEKTIKIINKKTKNIKLGERLKKSI